MNITERELKYLGLLSKQYPSAASAAAEIINLSAILNLPKGTEHFLADIHGEYERYSSGKYQNNTGIQPSLLYQDFKE